MIKLKCEICGANYEKPAHYKKWNNVFFKWSLRFCDDCRRKKEKEELTFRTSRIPEYKQTEKKYSLEIIIFVLTFIFSTKII